MYNAATGKLCLVDCQYPATSVGADSMDCKIRIDIQPPSINPDGEYLAGKGSSTREKSDPLWNCTKTKQWNRSWGWTLKLIAMVLISLTVMYLYLTAGLPCQEASRVASIIFNSSAPYLTVWHMIPLVLNFEAMLFMNRIKNILLWSAGWIEVNVVTMRVMTMVALMLQFRLLRGGRQQGIVDCRKESSQVMSSLIFSWGL